jgi:2-polyprenyl-6-methoxyphenol hydroxylase-like FAD-dependent oxidoreductase
MRGDRRWAGRLVVGLLLARAGVEVTVLEKHADFLRDFRGDTVHPSTLELLDELGLAERFAKLPHGQLHELAFPVEDHHDLVIGDFRRLKVRHPYIAMVPQWDLLNLLAEAAKEERTFTLRMRTEVVEVIQECLQQAEFGEFGTVFVEPLLFMTGLGKDQSCLYGIFRRGFLQADDEFGL